MEKIWEHPKHPLVYGLGLLSMYIVIIVRPLLKPLRFHWGSVQPTDRFTRVVVRGRNPTAPTMTEYQEIAHTLNAVSRLAECVCTLSTGRHVSLILWLLGCYTAIWNGWWKSTCMDTTENIYCATLKIYKALLNWKQRLLKEKVAIWSTLTVALSY